MANKEEIKNKVNKTGQKLDELGHKIDKDIRDSAEKHGLPAWKVWVFWFGVAVLAGVVVYLVV